MSSTGLGQQILKTLFNHHMPKAQDQILLTFCMMKTQEQNLAHTRITPNLGSFNLVHLLMTPMAMPPVVLLHELGT